MSSDADDVIARIINFKQKIDHLEGKIDMQNNMLKKILVFMANIEKKLVSRPDCSATQEATHTHAHTRRFLNV